LRKEYIALQQQSHPDILLRSTSGGGSAKGQGQDISSAYISEAYRTLLSPLKRAEYLLSLHGIIPADETDASIDQSFLIEVLEIRESVDDAENRAELETLKAENEQRVRQSEHILEGLFGEAVSESKLEEARREVVRMRYWEMVGKSLDAKDEELS
jgi:molecular chaperone HscB